MPPAIPMVIAMAVSMVVSVALSFISQAIMGSGSKKKPPAPPDSRDSTGLSTISRNPVEPRRVVYGYAKVSGPLVFAATSPKDDKANAYLHMVIPVASHPIAAFYEVYFNEHPLELVDTGGGVFAPRAGTAYSFDTQSDGGQVNVQFFDGNQTQACETLVAANVGWSGYHVLRGIAYMYVRLEWKEEFTATNFPGGIPNIAVHIAGKSDVYDPRSLTFAFTTNPALCIRDYLTNQSFGLACDGSEVLDSNVSAAANICDEAVALADGTSQNRYSCSGVVTLDKKPIEILESLLSSCDGTIIYSEGYYSIHPAAYVTPVVSLDEDDLRGEIKVHARPSRRDLFNTVRGNFTSEAKGWIADSFPPVTSAFYQAQDNGEQIFKDLDLPFTINTVAAQRLAKVHLERSRQGVRVEFPAKLTALRIRAWDIVYLSVAKFGWSSKPFRVTEWVLAEGGGIDLQLQEEAAASYDWNYGDATDHDPAPDTNLPNPFHLAAPHLDLSDDIVVGSGGIPITRLIADVTPPPDVMVVGYEAQYREAGGAWHDVAGGTRIVITPVIDLRSYEVRVRAISVIGIRSPWSAGSHLVIGQSAPPDDVDDFAINILGDQATGTWKAVANVDLSHYRIRWSPLTSGATWESAVDLVPQVARPATSISMPALVGSFLIKAVNYHGIESVNATISASTIAAVIGLNLVATIDEDPGFAGEGDGVFAVAGGLRLDSTDLVSDWPLISAVPLISYGLEGMRTEGTYSFAGTPYDLGGVFTSRVTASIAVTGSLVIDLVSLWELVSARQSITGTEAGEYSVRLQVRTTNDDPAGSPTWSEWRDFVVGDYTCRAFDFRAVLESYKQDVTPIVTALSARIDMPDRIISGTVASSSSTSTTVTFSPAFKATPHVGVTINDMVQGDRWTVTATTTGFTLDVWNSGGSRVVRNCTYFVRGYGQ